MIDNMVIISCLARGWGEGGGLKRKNGSVGLEYVVVTQAWTGKRREYSSTCKQHQHLSTVQLQFLFPQN